MNDLDWLSVIGAVENRAFDEARDLLARYEAYRPEVATAISRYGYAKMVGNLMQLTRLSERVDFSPNPYPLSVGEATRASFRIRGGERWRVRRHALETLDSVVEELKSADPNGSDEEQFRYESLIAALEIRSYLGRDNRWDLETVPLDEFMSIE